MKPKEHKKYVALEYHKKENPEIIEEIRRQLVAEGFVVEMKPEYRKTQIALYAGVGTFYGFRSILGFIKGWKKILGDK